ncbi:hemerythrin domain-containing protein [Neoroseomonas lacus]|uniref:Hemerythrin-like domain-containing protein n=1 Tax=Neoroseomonas lacus TaxID=287609 RepID=A0A917L4K5_9PROT|nr:hemerythrin domain-containing protein [Neoroseomonas lacus]GGJ40348.1 hypothetical protein GCM10011320_55010 [Neoroseomonas lacus]
MNAHPETPERRAALSQRLRVATGLDEVTLEAFQRAFYGAARQDPLLCAAFAGVADWDAHIVRLTQLWSSVALMTGTYHGQPMQAHAHLGLGTAHFARWMALFEETAVHRDHPDVPRGLADLLTRIEWELREHMQKEEQGLFPMLRVGHGPPMAIALMRDEHDDHGAHLRELAAITHAHEPPEDACNSWRALYAGTAQFAEDLTQHIHLENNVPFPRFGA